MEASSERPIPDQVTFADYVINSKHMDRHDRPYRCGRTECGHLKGFTYSGGLLRHERDVHGLHGGPKDQLRCTVSTCKRHAGKGFIRKENLDEHLRRVHGTTTADVVTTTGHQDFGNSKNKAPSVGNLDAEREIQHVIERQDNRDNANLADQVPTPAPTEQTSTLPNHTPQGPHQYPQYPARGNANLAVQTQGLLPRPRSTDQALTPTISVMTKRPYTPESQAQPQDSYHTLATSLHAPYTYANAPYINHNTFISSDASLSTMSTEVQIQGPPPQVGQVGQTAPQGGIASPINDNPALSRPISFSAVTSAGDTQQNGRKRAHEDAFPKSPGQTAVSQRPKRRLKVCELAARVIEHPVNSNNNGKSTEDLSGVQALLLRWFDASATDVLLRPSDG